MPRTKHGRQNTYNGALRRVLSYDRDGRRREGLVEVAHKLYDAAMDGESWAILEIANRIDGKSPQTVEVGDNLAAALEGMSLAELSQAAAAALAGLNQPAEPLTITVSPPEPQ